MNEWQLLLLFAIGIPAGWLNVMAGGGSMLTVPLLLFMGIPGPAANGTNRIGILMQNIVAVRTFHKQGFGDFKLSMSLAAVASIGAIGGALVGTRLEGEWFDRVLALVLLGMLLLMATGKKSAPIQSSGSAPAKNLLLGHALMFLAGIWGGFIQIGVGFILMPILHRVLGLDLVRVNMHKVFIVLVFTVIALLVFASQVEIYWQAGIALALGTMLGGWLGTRSSIRYGEAWIKPVLYVAVLAVIAKLLWF